MLYEKVIDLPNLIEISGEDFKDVGWTKANVDWI